MNQFNNQVVVYWAKQKICRSRLNKTAFRFERCANFNLCLVILYYSSFDCRGFCISKTAR